jgi:hypothetical protein
MFDFLDSKFSGFIFSFFKPRESEIRRDERQNLKTTELISRVKLKSQLKTPLSDLIVTRTETFGLQKKLRTIEC